MRTGYLARNTLYYFLGSASTKLIQFFFIPVYIKFIHPDTLGFYDFINTTVIVIMPLLFQSIWDAVLRFGFDMEDEEDICRMFCTAIFHVGGLSVVYGILALIISIYGDFTYIGYIYSMILANMLMSIWQAAARALKLNKIYSIASVVSVAVGVASNIILIIGLGMKLEALLLSNIAACISSVIIIELKLRMISMISFKLFSTRVLKRLLVYSSPLIISGMSWQLLNFASRLLIPIIFGLGDSGIYGIALRFSTAVSMLTSVFDMAWKEEMMRIAQESNKDKYFNDVFDNLMRFCFGGLLVLTPITALLLPMLIHGEYTNAINLIPLLYLDCIFAAFSSHMSSVFLMIKKTRLTFYTTTSGAAITILLMLTLANFLGLLGFALASFIGTLYRFIICAVIANRIVKVNIDYKAFSGLSIIYGIFIYAFFNFSYWYNVLLILAGGLIALYMNRMLLSKMTDYLRELFIIRQKGALK